MQLRHLEKNRAHGKFFEEREFQKFSQENTNAVEQVTIKTESGTRSRLDVVINEYKSSATAPLTKNEKVAFPENYKSGSVVVGKGKGIVTGGYNIPAWGGLKL